MAMSDIASIEWLPQPASTESTLFRNILLSGESLTALLQKKLGGNIKIKLLKQELCDNTWHRDVIISAEKNSHPCLIAARSLFSKTLEATTELNNLKENSLATIIYDRFNCQRQIAAYCNCNKKQFHHFWGDTITTEKECFTGRKSIFTIKDQSLTLYEFFIEHPWL